MQTFLVLRRFNELIPLCRCCGYADDERSNEERSVGVSGHAVHRLAILSRFHPGPSPRPDLAGL